MIKRIVFIINPISGKGFGKKVEPIIDAFFKDKPFEIQTIYAEYPGHATTLTENCIELKPDLIVACGGDGTINEVAKALIGQNIPLGILPIGSGNGLASNLKIPRNINKALQFLITNESHYIDVGKINDRYFFSNCGFGIDAHVIQRYAAEKKRNFIGYFKATLRTILNFKAKKLELSINGKPINTKDYFFFLISNSNEAGFGITFTPKAKLNDGIFDVIGVEKLNFFQLIKFSYCVITKQLHRFDKANIYQVKDIVVRSKGEFTIVQIDGEANRFKTNVYQIQLLPNALKVVTCSVN